MIKLYLSLAFSLMVAGASFVAAVNQGPSQSHYLHLAKQHE